MIPWRKFWNEWRIGILSVTIALLVSLTAGLALKPAPTPAPSPIATPPPTPAPIFGPPPPVPIAQPKTTLLHGHFPYAEADPGRMLIVGSYAQRENQRFERLSQEAALFLMRMIYAAREEGVWIIPVSGYRSIRDQEAIFTTQVKKLGSITAAAKVSAPPGHSEHHTGYAVDLADGGYPNRDVTQEFVDTEAFEWLQKNAKTFGYELSFPENNPRGISYEPWHWRYVGSPVAKGIFAAARRRPN